MDKAIIYGAGNMGQAVLGLLKDKCEIVGFMDGDPKLRGNIIDGIRIYHLSDIGADLRVEDLTALVAMTACPFSTMKKRLADLGFHKIFPAGDYVGERYREIKFTNIWHLDGRGAEVNFSDESSYTYYKAACEWFGARADFELKLDRRKYFPDFLAGPISGCKTMLDTGALGGEYIDDFLDGKGDGAVYAFALIPCTVPLGQLKERYRDRPVKLFNKSAADRNGMEARCRIGMMKPFTRVESYEIPLEKIDTAMAGFPYDYLRCYSIDEVLPILEGGENTIRKYRPVIAANIGHYKSDFKQVPDYLASICRKYNFYFRMHSYHGNDCILYAVPHEREEHDKASVYKD